MPDFTSSLDEMNGVPTADDVYTEFDLPIPPPRRPDASAELKDALVRKPDGSMAFRGFRLDSIGLAIEPSMSEQDWEDLGYILNTFDERRQWWIGDWLAHGELAWRKTYAWAAERFGYEVQSLRDMAYVCKAVKVSVRTDTLSFAHHKLVASSPPELQAAWLQYAAKNGLSIAILRQYTRTLGVFDSQLQRDWVQWMGEQDEMNPDILREAVRLALERDNPTLSQKPPTPFNKTHFDLLSDTGKLIRNEQKLEKASPDALRACAKELGELAQRMFDLADEKEQRQ